MALYFSLIFALSLDTFMAALSYESNKIKIPISSNLIISFICSLFLFISLLLGNFLGTFIPDVILKWISFFILFFIGFIKVFDNRIKNFIKKRNFKGKSINFSFCNLRFILQIYSDYSCADVDKSKSLSPIEAICLALALSIDGLSAGIAFNTSFILGLFIFLSCFIMNFGFILLSKLFNHFMNNKLDFSLFANLYAS
ncbi:MAG: hypothetical protein HFH46_04025, partial [Bacilli bacterium]|nr:hypothetical protein [Bacilli bacterium]